MKIIECPRDAMQGYRKFIKTDDKIQYLNQLLTVGYDVLDAGSFVSPKIIPQMSDTKTVLENLDSSNFTKISVIVASIIGAEKAILHENVSILGYPFSISETFQQRNTHKSRMECFEDIKKIKQELLPTNKEIIVYFSMAFGNPYGDDWSATEVEYWAEKFAAIDISVINLSDTVGIGTEQKISNLFSILPKKFPKIEFGAHFHCYYQDGYQKIKLANSLGCNRFDVVIKGFGGCPLANDEMVGNLPTEQLIQYLITENIPHHLNLSALETATMATLNLFKENDFKQ